MFPFQILSELGMTEVMMTTVAVSHAKLQSNSHHQRPTFCRPDAQRCWSTEGKFSDGEKSSKSFWHITRHSCCISFYPAACSVWREATVFLFAGERCTTRSECDELDSGLRRSCCPPGKHDLLAQHSWSQLCCHSFLPIVVIIIIITTTIIIIRLDGTTEYNSSLRQFSILSVMSCMSF